MKFHSFLLLLFVSICVCSSPLFADLAIQDRGAKGAEQSEQTNRIQQFETDEVQVWKTTIFPNQPLKMHRHDNKRIVVALTDTELKVTNDKSESHFVKWKKGSAHLLNADRPNELHADINESDHPMEVMVIQFKN